MEADQGETAGGRQSQRSGFASHSIAAWLWAQVNDARMLCHAEVKDRSI